LTLSVSSSLDKGRGREMRVNVKKKVQAQGEALSSPEKVGQMARRQKLVDIGKVLAIEALDCPRVLTPRAHSSRAERSSSIRPSCGRRRWILNTYGFLVESTSVSRESRGLLAQFGKRKSCFIHA
jgi:hypothetical protein